MSKMSRALLKNNCNIVVVNKELCRCTRYLRRKSQNRYLQKPKLLMCSTCQFGHFRPGGARAEDQVLCVPVVLCGISQLISSAGSTSKLLLPLCARWPAKSRSSAMAINNDVKWVKFDPRVSFTTMLRMTLEERGAYATLFDAACINDGSIEDDIKVLSKIMGIDQRVCRRIRQRLLDLEVIYLHAGAIQIDCVHKAVSEAKDRIQSASNAGLCSAAKRKVGRNNIRDLGATSVERASGPTSTPTRTHSSIAGTANKDTRTPKGQPSKRVSDLSRSDLEEVHRRRLRTERN